MSTDEQPLRLDGEVHPVPLVGAALFGCLALVGVVLTFVDDGLAVGVVVTLIFGTLAALFGFECIPPWVELDDTEIRYREKLRKGRVRYVEIQALGTGLENEENPGSLLVRLTDAACAARGIVRRDAIFHLSIPAVPSCRQKELLELAVERWESAGGSGKTFTLLEEFLEAGKTLRKAAGDLLELQRKANPETAAAIDAMRADPEEASDETADDDVYCSILHVTNDAGGLFFCIVAGSDRLDDLVTTIRQTAERLAREHRFNPEFSGEIQISLVPDLTRNTRALRENMDALVSELEEKLPHTTTKLPIRVSWSVGLPNHSS